MSHRGHRETQSKTIAWEVSQLRAALIAARAPVDLATYFFSRMDLKTGAPPATVAQLLPLAAQHSGENREKAHRPRAAFRPSGL
jgi:hypothetical protein